MKKYLFFLYCFFTMSGMAQTVDISEDIYVGNTEGYGIIGKMNDRILFYHLDNGVVKCRAYDAKMRKIWERDLEADRKNTAKILDIVGNKTDFSVIYQYRKKNRNVIKIQKYDGQVKLLDSASVCEWSQELGSPTLHLQVSEDKKSVLIYEIISHNRIKAAAISLDSLKTKWVETFDTPNWNSNDDHFEQIIFTNQYDVFFIREEDILREKHRFEVSKYSIEDGKTRFSLPLNGYPHLETKFSFDNINRHLVAVALYYSKNMAKAIGYLSFIIPLDYKENDPLSIHVKAFDDEFVTAFIGKKTTDNKGLVDLRVQEIVHRRDGGFLAIIEQVKIVQRRITENPLGRYYAHTEINNILMDYYLDNIFAVSIGSDGITHWKSIFYKKQFSQSDDGRYSSYCLVKTPSSLRFLFNDDIERATTVSEYTLNSVGETARHSIMNTAGQDVLLRFHDAVQVGANEVIVPSDDRRHVKLLRIQF